MTSENRFTVDWAGGHEGVPSDIELRWWGAFIEGDPCTGGRAKRPSPTTHEV